MRIDMQEIERIGGRVKNPDIDAALRLLELNGLILKDKPLPKADPLCFFPDGPNGDP